MIEKIIKAHLLPEEDYIYGFADLTGLLDKKFEGFNWGISIGRKQCAEFGRLRLDLDARVCVMCVASCPIGRKNQ